jgi:hypothetical protein
VLEALLAGKNLGKLASLLPEVEVDLGELLGAGADIRSYGFLAFDPLGELLDLNGNLQRAGGSKISIGMREKRVNRTLLARVRSCWR